MRNMIFRAVLLAVCGLAFSAAGAEHVLWQIGESDNSSAEFSLGAGGWQRYTAVFETGCFYVAGQSNAAEDFSYVLPGPSDVWAGGRKHELAIVFGIDKSAESTGCRLMFDLLDTHYLFRQSWFSR